MPALFSALATLYTSAAQIAAALGMTRQAYSQAAKRRRLSEPKAMLAGVLIGISPAKALFLNATGKDTPAPINNPTPHPCPQILDEKKQAQSPPDNFQPTNYAHLEEAKKSPIIPAMQKNVHVIPQSKKRLFEIDCVRWMLSVPKISPDSPRFVQYFSRWVIPEKIAYAKQQGTFDEATKTCTSFAPELCSFIAAGIAEYLKFTGQPAPQEAGAVSIAAPPIVKLPTKHAR